MTDATYAGASAPEKLSEARLPDARLPDGRFAPGHSGNPKGRPRGPRAQTQAALDELLATHAEALMRKAIELALDGDLKALKFCIDRILPRARSRPVEIELPPADTADDVAQSVSAVAKAAANGDVEPRQAHHLAAILDIKRRCFETAEIEVRVRKLEDAASIMGTTAAPSRRAFPRR
ncbi:MAG: DUF5681 domain-containing protein [Rhodospirillaceae bacterium]|nr:DUF5681 domain-containing protein [Rhodospirillaceae bacterium]